MTAARDASDLPGPRVLVVDADPALLGLLEEWLVPQGCSVLQEGTGVRSGDGFDLIVVDVPFPRRGLDVLRRVAREHPGAPILALSSSFFAGIASTGAVARALGVTGVLPKPVTRGALLAAVGGLLDTHK